MTAVRFVDSLRYGGKLFASVLAVVLVGSGAIAGGAALALPGRVPAVTGPVTTSRLAGGVLLAGLGTAVVAVGLLGAVHKLVADSVSAGQTQTDAGSDQPSSTPVPGDTTDSDPPATESDPGEEAQPATDTTGSGGGKGGGSGTEDVAAEDVFDDWVQKTSQEPEDARPARAGEAGTDESQQGSAGETGQGREERREPSPEEIAFGTEDDEPDPAEDTGETRVEGDHDGGRPADRSGTGKPTEQAGTGGGDPLAERTDEE